MPVRIRNPDIFNSLESMGDHFNKNISNRFMRKILLNLDIPQSDWDKLEGIGSKLEYYKIEGIQLDEIYEFILAGARLIHKARANIVPNLRGMLALGSGFQRASKPGDQDRTLRDMAAQTFPVNLGIFSDMLNELYQKTAAIDRSENSKKTPCTRRYQSSRTSAVTS